MIVNDSYIAMCSAHGPAVDVMVYKDAVDPARLIGSRRVDVSSCATKTEFTRVIKIAAQEVASAHGRLLQQIRWIDELNAQYTIIRSSQS